MAAFSATLAATSPLAPPPGLLPVEALSRQQAVAGASTSLSKGIRDLLFDQTDWDKAAVLRMEDGGVVAATFSLEPQDIKVATGAFDAGRDAVVACGLQLQGKRFDVHCFQPPIIYGRSTSLDESEGIALVRGTGADGQKLVALATFRPPLVSSYAVPLLVSFFRTHLGSVPRVPAPVVYDQTMQRN
ncbi:profilin [Cystoisospora suis]|uniref:Profilin n=1 Tax=Cystoisospora suis TaxID=483139 RepID=A0A2C6L225_9APIC|nr:profilin [Cystoisospora suis]